MGIASGLLHEGRETIEVQAIASHRAHEIGAAPFENRVQGVRVRHVLLDEVFIVVANGDVEALVRNQAALIERVLGRVAERHELVVLLEVGHVEGRDPANRVERLLAGPLECADERRQLGSRRHPVEAADAHVHGMDLAAADDADDFVPGLFEIECALDFRGMVLCHPDRIFVPEEVGGVQHGHVECVALDPFAAGTGAA